MGEQPWYLPQFNTQEEVFGRMDHLMAVLTQITITHQNTIVQQLPADGIVHLIRAMPMQEGHPVLGFVLLGESK